MTDVVLRDVPVVVHAVGNVEATSTVELKARVADQVAAVAFAEGDHVHAGDLLFSLDPRPFQAALERATAALARDEAAARLAATQASRTGHLFEQAVSSQDELDVATARASAAQAVLEADRAEVESARLALDYCSIRSPLDGVVGQVLVQAGNVVKENETTLAVVRQVVPVRVRFALPERVLAELRAACAQGAPRVSATPPGGREASGTVDFVDNAVDEATGTILVKGLFPNADERLWPGQSVDVVLTLSVQKDALVVPERALVLGQAGDLVFVVRADGTVESRPVECRRAPGDLAVVQKGLSAGETVVVEGQLRLVSGSRVHVVHDADKPAATDGTR